MAGKALSLKAPFQIGAAIGAIGIRRDPNSPINNILSKQYIIYKSIERESLFQCA